MAKPVTPDEFPGGRRDLADHPGFQWFVADIPSGTARATALTGKLDVDGYPVYLPSIVVTSHYATWTKIVRLPLFPGYLFVAFDPDQPINCRDYARYGMSGLLTRAGMAGVPCVIKPAAIEALRVAEDGGVLNKVNGTPAHSSLDGTIREMTSRGFRSGDRVRMTPDGLFSGMAGELIAAHPDMRISLLLDILGRKVPVKDVPLDHVEAISPDNILATDRANHL